MQSGSVYYHFKSKKEILLAVYEVGVERISARVKAAISDQSEPLERLRAAVRAHLEVILDESAYARVLTTVKPGEVAGLDDQLIQLRDNYENIFTGLLNELPFKKSFDPKMLRMILIGSANYAQWWYHPGKNSPAFIADQMTDLMAGALEK